MINWQFIIVIAIPLLVLFLLFLSSRKRKSQLLSKDIAQQHKTVQSQQHGTYYSVSIKPGPKACAAVLSLRGKRFLASEAPQFPLPECNSPLCECVYRHHEDRRTPHYDRRHASINMNDSSEVPGEKRSGTGRREAEHVQQENQTHLSQNEQ